MNVLLFAALSLVSIQVPPEPSRLATAPSPYLRQHASNPVDWYPWGQEALERARRENRPIFLSIGYSTCHWCHVMERESFSNPAVAAVLNEYFVSIKVDREERPDLDAVYLAWLSSTNGDAGWPANLLLTPDLVPFWGGTYFPPEARGGRPGLIDLARRLGEAWRRDPEGIAATASQMRGLVESMAAGGERASASRLHAEVRDRSLATFDHVDGGFSAPPKFPQPARLMFLLGLAANGDRDAASAVTTTLDAVTRGAIHDHLGGGFHRYATDARWRVPHFEKMLYDQALLARVLAEASVVLDRDDYMVAALDTLRFAERELGLPGGLWAAALGAESAVDDGSMREGAFYVWDDGALRRAVPAPALHRVASLYFGVGERAAPLYHAAAIEDVAGKLDISPDEAASRLARARSLMLLERSRRPSPFRDEKVITAWNSMMISSLSRVGTLVGDEALVTRAVVAAERLWSSARLGNGHLARSISAGHAHSDAVADDYAWLTRASLDLYDATLDPRWITRSFDIQSEFRERLGNEEGDDFRRGKERLPFDMPAGPDDGDTAESHWASVQLENLLRLAALTADPAWETRARDFGTTWVARISGQPQNWPHMVDSLTSMSGKARQIVIASRPGDPAGDAMLELARRRWRGTEILLHSRGDGDPVVQILPHLEGMRPIDGRATAYVCENYTCRQPATSPNQLRDQLEAISLDGDPE